MPHEPGGLEARSVSKSFGAIAAVSEVSLTVSRGEIHAVIGPNGAGKSTLISVLSGDAKSNSGQIWLNGREVSKQPNWRRSLGGMGRVYQTSSLMEELTLLQNVMLSVMARQGFGLASLKRFAGSRELAGPALEALRTVGLEAKSYLPVSSLSHGERRQLEMSMVLANGASVLLLDEPMAGMGPEETARLIGILQSIKQSHAVILVEHDMSAVFTLADTISVLVYGKIIFTGPPDAARRDENVRRSYLGNDDDY
jgi:branched-chain amino acid transport system ATP-binding protein